MRYFYHILFCAALLAFFFGLLYGTTDNAQVEQPVRNPNHQYSRNLTEPTTFDEKPDVKIDTPDAELPSCSEVNTMPCTSSPPNPVKDALDATDSGDGIFKKGQEVTCIYQGIFWWTDRSEFVKAVPMVCKVIAASQVWNDLEPGYQHVQVDCSKDLETKWSDQPGAGMVKGHKLNPKVQWMPSTSCYHFVQH